MLTALAVLFSLAGLLLASFGAIRIGRARRLREIQSAWARLASDLGAELRIGEDGRLSIRGRRGDAEWELDQRIGLFARPGLRAWFEAADRLAPARVWREPPDDVRTLERTGSEEFRTVYQVEQGPIAAGCVRWLDDTEVQDLLLASHAFAAAVIGSTTVLAASAPTVWIVLEPRGASSVDDDSVRLAIEWAARMAMLAREGVAAAPPH
jgi:hypothetical protein